MINKCFFNIISKNGNIKYYNFDESIINDFDVQSDLLVEDMLYIEYPKNIVMDIGWYNGVKGFIIFIIRESNWEAPIEKRICKDVSSLIENIKECNLNIQRLIKLS